ncbi:uncharacterized protein LOC130558330 isoform X2 [Triplophysa rosa]|uniref:uncharacterized protein LOC130558330 isoform X2 n=1 Tax=Triplophysa rosa TaxID=992332 RepID=UPI002545D0F0|nr:uncharacterized protein LOC130558330 isoform X2 [Triplophysa rosa]
MGFLQHSYLQLLNILIAALSECKECKVLKPVWTTPKSSITLPCPELLNVTWEVVHGDQSIEITNYSCKHSQRTQGATKPLCERSKRNNTSLIIRDVVNSDALWYRCRGNKTCYDVKLQMKDYETSHETTALSTTVSTDAPASAVSNVGQKEDSRSSTAAVASVLSVCIVASLIICVIIYLKIRKSETTSQNEFRQNSLYFARDSVYYSQISEGLQFPLYHLLENNSEALTTFGDVQTEAAACRYVSQSATKCSS